MLILIFIFSLFFLFYIYGGFLLLLKSIYFFKHFFSLFNSQKYSYSHIDSYPPVTIFFSAFNEETNIIRRLDNLISLKYPKEKIEIIVFSDGSKDKTVFFAEKFAKNHPQYDITVVDFSDNYGQSRSQNEVAKISKHDILVSTDSDSIFSTDILEKLISPFSNPRVGVVGGVVIYDSEKETIGNSYKKYRNLEFEIRKFESLLGVGVKTDGPCLAYRKSFWSEINDWEDVDQVISLFAVKSGFTTVQADQAICFDKANKSPKQEIRQRSRMTKKALFSTFGRWSFPDIIKYPIFSFILFSHKIIRFFSPVFLILLIVSSLALILLNLKFISFYFFVILSFFMITLYFTRKTLIIRSFLHHLSSFFIANLSFLIGILLWLRGEKSGKYVPTRNF